MSCIENLSNEMSFHLLNFLPDRDLCTVGLLNNRYKLLTDDYLTLYRKNSLKIKSAWQEYVVALQEYKATKTILEATTKKRDETSLKLENIGMTALEKILFHANTYACLSSCLSSFEICIKLKKVKKLREQQNKYDAEIAFLVSKKNKENSRSLALHITFCNYKRGEKLPVYSSDEESHTLSFDFESELYWERQSELMAEQIHLRRTAHDDRRYEMYL